MKVVWAYADWSGNGHHDLAESSWQAYCLIASVLSWMEFAPNFTRVFYVDQNVYDWLSERDLLQYWDRVEIVDFVKEIDERYNTHFFAFPKMWSFTQQEEPFFICDTDKILLKPISCFISDWTKPHGELYSHTKNIPLSNNPNTTEDTMKFKEFVQFDKLSRLTPGLRSLCNFDKCLSAGLIYFPDPVKAQILGRVMMSVTADLTAVEPTPGSWVLYEEALIPTIMEAIGSPVVDFDYSDLKQVEGVDMGKVGDYEDLEKLITNKLRVNIREEFPWLLKEEKTTFV